MFSLSPPPQITALSPSPSPSSSSSAYGRQSSQQQQQQQLTSRARLLDHLEAWMGPRDRVCKFVITEAVARNPLSPIFVVVYRGSPEFPFYTFITEGLHETPLMPPPPKASRKFHRTSEDAADDYDDDNDVVPGGREGGGGGGDGDVKPLHLELVLYAPTEEVKPLEEAGQLSEYVGYQLMLSYAYSIQRLKPWVHYGHSFQFQCNDLEQVLFCPPFIEDDGFDQPLLIEKQRRLPVSLQQAAAAAAAQVEARAVRSNSSRQSPTRSAGSVSDRAAAAAAAVALELEGGALPRTRHARSGSPPPPLPQSSARGGNGNGNGIPEFLTSSLSPPPPTMLRLSSGGRRSNSFMGSPAELRAMDLDIEFLPITFLQLVPLTGREVEIKRAIGWFEMAHKGLIGGRACDFRLRRSIPFYLEPDRETAAGLGSTPEHLEERLQLEEAALKLLSEDAEEEDLIEVIDCFNGNGPLGRQRRVAVAAAAAARDAAAASSSLSPPATHSGKDDEDEDAEEKGEDTEQQREEADDVRNEQLFAAEILTEFLVISGAAGDQHHHHHHHHKEEEGKIEDAAGGGGGGQTARLMLLLGHDQKVALVSTTLNLLLHEVSIAGEAADIPLNLLSQLVVECPQAAERAIDGGAVSVLLQIMSHRRSDEAEEEEEEEDVQLRVGAIEALTALALASTEGHRHLLLVDHEILVRLLQSLLPTQEHTTTASSSVADSKVEEEENEVLVGQSAIFALRRLAREAEDFALALLQPKCTHLLLQIVQREVAALRRLGGDSDDDGDGDDEGLGVGGLRKEEKTQESKLLELVNLLGGLLSLPPPPPPRPSSPPSLSSSSSSASTGSSALPSAVGAALAVLLSDALNREDKRLTHAILTAVMSALNTASSPSSPVSPPPPPSSTAGSDTSKRNASLVAAKALLSLPVGSSLTSLPGDNLSPPVVLAVSAAAVSADEVAMGSPVPSLLSSLVSLLLVDEEFAALQELSMKILWRLFRLCCDTFSSQVVEGGGGGEEDFAERLFGELECTGQLAVVLLTDGRRTLVPLDCLIVDRLTKLLRSAAPSSSSSFADGSVGDSRRLASLCIELLGTFFRALKQRVGLLLSFQRRCEKLQQRFASAGAFRALEQATTSRVPTSASSSSSTLSTIAFLREMLSAAGTEATE